MIRNENLVTNSRLSDWIKDIWRYYKNSDFPISGDYYYTKIDQGILFGKIIKIPIEHLPKELRLHLNNTPNHIVKEIISKSVEQIFQEKFGSRLTRKAIRENRIEIVLV